MKPIRILLIFIITTLITSCHSQKRATTGKDVPAKPVTLNGKADNMYTRQLMTEAYSWLGTPYKYGGTSKKGADCSGLVMTIYKNSLGIDLPRVSRDQGNYCRKIGKSDLFPGDLVFFSSGKGKGKVNHVGIYVGDNKILHASSSRGVIVSDLSVNYYANHYHHAGMVPDYRKKAFASASSGKSAEKKKKDTGKKKKKAKQDAAAYPLPESPAPSVSKEVPKDAIEIPASQLFKPNTPEAVTPDTPKREIPTPAPIRYDSAYDINADTVHLMVYFRPKP